MLIDQIDSLAMVDMVSHLKEISKSLYHLEALEELTNELGKLNDLMLGCLDKFAR